MWRHHWTGKPIGNFVAPGARLPRGAPRADDHGMAARQTAYFLTLETFNHGRMDLPQVKAAVKAWEKSFKALYDREPTKDDIKRDASGVGERRCDILSWLQLRDSLLLTHLSLQWSSMRSTASYRKPAHPPNKHPPRPPRTILANSRASLRISHHVSFQLHNTPQPRHHHLDDQAVQSKATDMEKRSLSKTESALPRKPL